MRRTLLIPLSLLVIAAPLAAAPRKPGTHETVAVGDSTRLDWTFAVASRSLATTPPAWLGDYDSTKQTYDLFVPTRRNPKAPMPVILFLSPGNDGGGWKAFERLAKAEGVLVASPRGAGNDCPGRQRVRIVLDVLDDLRRNYPVDPDQTYIAGFSGGGRIACAVAFALPELFAGVIPICAGGNLRDESWLRRRAADRLSIAMLTGEKDFNRGEVERLRGPYLTEVGVRTKVWTQPGLGHAIPNDKTLREAYQWLQAGQPRLLALAKKYPDAKIRWTQAPTRAELAAKLLAEGKGRLAEKGGQYAGLMQMKGVLERWPDVPAAAEAKKLLLEYDDKAEKPWEKDDLAEQRRFLIASARALTAYATGPLDAQYVKQRPDMLRQAMKFWKEIADDQPDAAVGKEAKKRIGELEKELGE